MENFQQSPRKITSLKASDFSDTCIKRPLNFVVSQDRRPFKTGRIKIILYNARQMMISALAITPSHQMDGADRLLYGRLGRGRGGDQAIQTFPYTGPTGVLRISVLKFHVKSLGVQQCTTYRGYREPAVQDTYGDTKDLIKILIVTIYHILLFDSELQN